MTMADRARRFVENGMALHRRQPLVAAAALLLAGIVCGYRFGVWPVAAGGAAACGLLLAWVRGPLGRNGLAALGILLLGWAVAAKDLGGRRDEASRFGERPPRQTFVCRVGPDVVVKPMRGNSAKFTFRGERLRTEDGAFACRRLPVEVNWFGARAADPASVPGPGEMWRLTGSAKIKKGRDGLPTLIVNTGEDRSEKLSATDPSSWLARIAAARRQAVGRVTVGIENWGVVPSLNQAMLLGCRSEIPPEMRRVFANSGTIHVFAISGLNIALVAGLLVVLVSAAGVARPYWALGVAPLLVFYTLASGAQPSAVRACLMAIIYFAAPLFGRKPSGIVALSATALIVYACAPSMVYNIGCTLSFAVMGGLVVFCRPFCMAGRRLCRLDRLEQVARMSEQAGSPAAGVRVRWTMAGVRFLIDSVAVSLAAWLASLPLTAYYFARFTPGGFFANLVISPCAFLVMVAGSLGLVTSFVSDWIASVFNHAAGFFTVIMIRTAEMTAGCGWANFRIARWEPWMVWIWFGALAAWAAWLNVRRPSDGLAWLDGVEGMK